MGVAAQLEPNTKQFVNAPVRKMLIDGKWVEAASGKSFETPNPATGETLARVAEGDAEDIDRAVKAARRAFDEGPWRKTNPMQREGLLPAKPRPVPGAGPERGAGGHGRSGGQRRFG